MKITVIMLLVWACLGLACLSCAKKEKTSPPKQEAEPIVYAVNLLSSQPETDEIKRLGGITRTMRAEADTVLGQRAQGYLSYNLLGLASADYLVKEVKVTVEVAQFPTPEDAYGFYSSLRPPAAPSAGLGTESCSRGQFTHFTHGEFAVALSTQERDSTHLAARTLLGQQIDGRIASAATPPPLFMLFPLAGKIPFTNRYYAHDYLDVAEVDKVYTTSYLAHGDTAVLFLTMDESGEKFLKLRLYAEASGREVSSAPSSFSFEEQSLSFRDPNHGTIVAGLIRSKLVGIIGYDRAKNKRLATGWVQGLK